MLILILMKRQNDESLYKYVLYLPDCQTPCLIILDYFLSNRSHCEDINRARWLASRLVGTNGLVMPGLDCKIPGLCLISPA